MLTPKIHLLKAGSYFITVCGIDTEYQHNAMALFDKDKDAVTCKRCVATMIKENRQRLLEVQKLFK